MILHIDALKFFDVSDSGDNLEITVGSDEYDDVTLCISTGQWLSLVSGVIKAMGKAAPDTSAADPSLH